MCVKENRRRERSDLPSLEPRLPEILAKGFKMACLLVSQNQLECSLKSLVCCSLAVPLSDFSPFGAVLDFGQPTPNSAFSFDF